MTPYLRLAAHYRSLITQGAYPPGNTLPPVSDVAQEHHVAPGTVTRAWALLRAEGLIETRGKRIVVAERGARSAPQRAGGYPEGLTVEADTPEWTDALPEWAQILDSDRAVRRSRRVLGSDGVPTQHSVSYVHPRVQAHVPEILTVGRMDPSWQRIYGLATNRPVTLTYATHGAVTADARDSEALDVPEGSALPLARHVYSDSEGIVGVSEARYAPGTLLPLD